MNLYERLKDKKTFDKYCKRHGVLMEDVKEDLTKNASYVNLKYSTAYRLFRIYNLSDFKPTSITQIFTH